MPRKRFTAEQIIHKLREADVLIGQGLKEPATNIEPFLHSTQTTLNSVINYDPICKSENKMGTNPQGLRARGPGDSNASQKRWR